MITDWRLPVPPTLMQDLFWQAAGPLIAAGEPSAVTLAGRPVAAADGMLVNLAVTKENRAFFGTTGTADWSSPFPQLRIIALIARAGRAMTGAVLGRASAGEPTLLKRLVRRRPELIAGVVVCFDRNFPGHDLVTAILKAGGHVVARMKNGIHRRDEPQDVRHQGSQNSRTLHQPSQIPGRSDFLPKFLPKRGNAADRDGVSPGHRNRLESPTGVR